MSILSLDPRIHADVPEAVYHERVLGVVNKGALDMMARTPGHYRAWVDDRSEQDETPALAFGKALHCRILEPDAFAARYIAARKHPFRRLTDAQLNAKKPSDETLQAIAYWNAWRIESEGRIELDADDAALIESMHAAVMAHPIASHLFAGGMREVTAVWTDPATGLLCKSRMDYWRPDINVIADLKSTEDASPSAFARSVANYRYAVQDAHYCDGIEVLTGQRPAFLFVAVEKSAPHGVCVYQLDPESAQRGATLRRRDMDALAECIRTDQWPVYPTGVNTLSLPAWAHKDAA